MQRHATQKYVNVYFLQTSIVTKLITVNKRGLIFYKSILLDNLEPHNISGNNP